MNKSFVTRVVLLILIVLICMIAMILMAVERDSGQGIIHESTVVWVAFSNEILQEGASSKIVANVSN